MAIGPARRRLILVSLRFAGLLRFERIAESRPTTFFHTPTNPAFGFLTLARKLGAVAHELVDRKVLPVLRNAWSKPAIRSR